MGTRTIRAAITAWRRALPNTPEGNDRVQLIANLTGALRMLHELHPDDAVSGEAVLLVRSTEGGGVAEARRLSHLASTVGLRYAATGDTHAADEAIAMLERAIELSDRVDADYASQLHNLADMLKVRHAITGDTTAVHRCVDLCRQALAVEDLPELQRSTYSLSLALHLGVRYRAFSDRASLDEAVAIIRDFVANGPRSAPNRPTLLGHAILVLVTYYEATGVAAVAEEATAVARDALQGLRDDHPQRARLLAGAAAIWERVYHHTKDPAALIEYQRSAVAASAVPGQTPAERTAMLIMAAAACVATEEWASAAKLYREAIETFPLLISRRLVREDQERWLAKWPERVRDAGAAALRADDPERGLTLIEYGRGTLFAQSLENRDDFDDLRTQHPDLADELSSVRDTLAGWTSAGGPAGDDHHRLARRWDTLVDQVRRLPGRDGLLRPPPISELLSAAEDGPVVVFSISTIRSDALIVRTDGIEVVPLPDAVAARAREFLDAIADHGDLTGVLGWLWAAVVEPVLDRLPDDPAQRVWWCPTESLSFLPLHAACRDGNSVLDRVVSSSTPTIRALLHARRVRTKSTARALVVAAAGADGVPELPGAEREVSLLAGKLPRSTVLRHASRGDVLTGIAEHNWAHFACHGITDTAHPSRSGLVLYDGLLTVADIAQLSLDTDLALLSACSTATATATATVGPVLPDEAIHLASAFQLAGYRHVEATLWPVRDTIAAAFARDFYQVVTGTARTARRWPRTRRPGGSATACPATPRPGERMCTPVRSL